MSKDDDFVIEFFRLVNRYNILTRDEALRLANAEQLSDLAQQFETLFKEGNIEEREEGILTLCARGILEAVKKIIPYVQNSEIIFRAYVVALGHAQADVSLFFLDGGYIEKDNIEKSLLRMAQMGQISAIEIVLEYIDDPNAIQKAYEAASQRRHNQETVDYLRELMDCGRPTSALKKQAGVAPMQIMETRSP